MSIIALSILDPAEDVFSSFSEVPNHRNQFNVDICLPRLQECMSPELHPKSLHLVLVNAIFLMHVREAAPK